MSESTWQAYIECRHYLARRVLNPSEDPEIVAGWVDAHGGKHLTYVEHAGARPAFLTNDAWKVEVEPGDWLVRWANSANTYTWCWSDGMARATFALKPEAQAEMEPYRGTSFHEKDCSCYHPSGIDDTPECGRDCPRCTCPKPTESTAQVLSEQRRRADTAEKRITELKAVIERDRTQIADGINCLNRALKQRSGLMDEGRGCYEWDDDRFKEEFRRAYQAFDEAMAPLRRIAGDLSNSPKTTAAVIAARATLTQENS